MEKQGSKLKLIREKIVIKNLKIPEHFMQHKIRYYTPPVDYISPEEQERKAKQKEEQQKLREWEDKQAAWKKWVESSPEQRVYGDLFIWKSRFKRENQRLPSIDEIKAKEQELIQALPSDEETQISIFGEVKYKDNTMDLFEDNKI